MAWPSAGTAFGMTQLNRASQEGWHHSTTVVIRLR